MVAYKSKYTAICVMTNFHYVN